MTDPPDPPLTFSQLALSDLPRYRPGVRPTWLQWLLRCPFHPGLVATMVLRAQQRTYARGHVRLAFLLRSLGVYLFSADFIPEIVVGTSLYMPHAMGIVMGVRVQIGNDVTILHGSTLGGAMYADGRGGEHALTVIEDGVNIAANCFVRSGVRVGRYAEIGANSVVLHDVPPYAVMVGAPARQVGTREVPGVSH
jgi:serine O-acetyltransferase